MSFNDITDNIDDTRYEVYNSYAREKSYAIFIFNLYLLSFLLITMLYCK